MTAHVSERMRTELGHSRLSKPTRSPSSLRPDTLLEPLQDLQAEAHTGPSRAMHGAIVTMCIQIE
jgi:hypothetical protein